MRKLLVLCLLSLFSSGLVAQKIVHYDLYVNDTMVNYSGKRVMAMAVNGRIPAPALSFTEGDTAEIDIHNLLNEPTAFHWHGVILPNSEDGVSYLTTAPIPANSVHRFRFPVIQNGTYWYHAHTMQEQAGLYGALVFHKKNEKPVREYTVVLSDWTDEDPMEVFRSLTFANDWYSIKKHSTQNWGEALVKGYFFTKAKQEWNRMLPMDVSDVYYNAFLCSGKTTDSVPELKAGDKIRLRIVNGSSATYFWLQFAGGKLKVVANDGNEVVPVEVDRMLIAIAETYDVVVTVPDNMSYELRATAEDRTNAASLWLGKGMKMPAAVLPRLKYFEGMKMMNSMSNMKGMQMSNQSMDMNTVMYPEVTGEPEKMKRPHEHNMEENKNQNLTTLNYTMLRSPVKTTLPAVTERVFYFELTGNMNRFQWSMNNRTVSDTNKILIHKGENVRIILNNTTMMRHPMHLHGHEFRLLNGQADYSPLKNTLDIMPMEVDTIEFAAKYDGDWFFHCHVLYHMMSGMGRIFSYANSLPNPQIDTIKNSWKMFLQGSDMVHFSAGVAAQSQQASIKVMAMTNKYVFDVTGVYNYKSSFESEGRFGRLFGTNQFLKVYVGGDARRIEEKEDKSTDASSTTIEKRNVATFGIQYLLPLFIQTDLRVDHKGYVRLQFSKNDWALTSRLRLDAVWNTDKEYETGLRYIVTKRISLSANYDSHFGGGGGVMFVY